MKSITIFAASPGSKVSRGPSLESLRRSAALPHGHSGTWAVDLDHSRSSGKATRARRWLMRVMPEGTDIPISPGPPSKPKAGQEVGKIFEHHSEPRSWYHKIFVTLNRRPSLTHWSFFSEARRLEGNLLSSTLPVFLNKEDFLALGQIRNTPNTDSSVDPFADVFSRYGALYSANDPGKPHRSSARPRFLPVEGRSSISPSTGGPSRDARTGRANKRRQS